MACCPAGSAPYLAPDHDDEGSVRSMDGVSFYHVGKGPTGLLIVPDVWGWNSGRTRALADMFAKKGFSVFIPKVLDAHEGGTDGDGLPPDFDLATKGSALGPLFKGAWNTDVCVPKVLKVVKAMQSSGVKKIAMIGVCYGGWLGIKVCKEVKMVCAACPHPSHHIESHVFQGDVAKLGEDSSCPWALYPCGEVGQPGADGDMYDPDGVLFKALEAKFPGKNETKRFSKMAHGFCTRGNIKEGEFNTGRGEDVKAAVEECVQDMTTWFEKFGLIKGPPQPPTLKKPKFTKVGKINPESKDLNLLLKCISCTETVGDDGVTKAWEAVLGDDTAVATFSIYKAEQADLCKAGAAIRVQNARVQMTKGHIRVQINKWAALKLAEEGEKLDGDANTEKDVSALEYELA